MGKNKGNRCCKLCLFDPWWCVIISILKAQIFAGATLATFSDFGCVCESSWFLKFEINEIARVSAGENLYQTLCNPVFYKEKSTKMSFTKACASQNVIRKNLFQIFCNLLDPRMFALAKVCALKVQVNPEPT